ncbi:sugar ABC transporter substrate-binding protein [Paenibacillus sp. YYML68]|uniref:ABC transporter substrate-binding protein n=1 Tax=Paenibacillus sp. YYML68 TaxID=2909250 RepID=UPI002491FE4F|nr:sugar ABC transporter substrate-binding protein [Paenibacillus sp. YYML68]
MKGLITVLMRKMTIVSVILVMALVVSGCSASNKKVAESEHVAEGSGAVTLRVAIRDYLTAEAEKVVAAFEKKYPNINVELEPWPTSEDQYRQKITTNLAANNLPDVIANLGAMSSLFADNGVTVNLDEMLKSDPDLNRDSFDAAFLNTGVSSGTKTKGEVHMLPLGADAIVIFYNKRLFDEANVPYPTSDWDYEKFIDTARKLTKKDDKGNTITYGANMRFKWMAVYNPLLANFGGSLVNAGGDQATFDSPEAIKGWKALVEPAKEGIFVPLTVQNDMGSDNAPFLAGKAAMFTGIRALVPVVRKSLKDDWDVVELPYINGVKKVGAGAVGFSITSKTKHKEEAWKFMKFIYDAEGGMKIFAENYSVVPPIKSLYTSAFWTELPGPPYSNHVFTDTLKYSVTSPPIPVEAGGAFNSAINEALEKYLLTDGLNLEELMQDAAVKATKALNKN